MSCDYSAETDESEIKDTGRKEIAQRSTGTTARFLRATAADYGVSCTAPVHPRAESPHRPAALAGAERAAGRVPWRGTLALPCASYRIRSRRLTSARCPCL